MRASLLGTVLVAAARLVCTSSTSSHTMADNTTTPVGGTIQHGGMPSTSITVQEGTAVVAEFQLQLVAQDLNVNTAVENGVLAAATTRHRRKFSSSCRTPI